MSTNEAPTLPSQKRLNRERDMIDGLPFDKLYTLYITWPVEYGFSKTAHYPYVKKVLLSRIQAMPVDEYGAFLKSRQAL